MAVMLMVIAVLAAMVMLLMMLWMIMPTKMDDCDDDVDDDARSHLPAGVSLSPCPSAHKSINSRRCHPLQGIPPHKRFLEGRDSPFMRLAEHLAEFFAIDASKQCLPGR